MSSNTNTDNCLPYNSLNVILKQGDVTSMLVKYGVTQPIRDINIYRNAFVHRSYCTRKNENFLEGNIQCPIDCIPLQEESNERLEFLGDAVINLIVARYLFERYPDENEGFLTKIRTKLVNGNMLATMSCMVHLENHVLISKQIEENNGRNNKKIMEDCFEAFLGAMFIDHHQNRDGYKAVETWLINFMEENIDFSELITSNNNYKDVLLKYFQHNFNYLPKFLEVRTENTSNGKVYHVCIKDKNDVVISTGSGCNKKQAENDCAKNALIHYGVYSL
jgi:ribonuclease-3